MWTCLLCAFVALDGHNPRKDNSLLCTHTDTRKTSNNKEEKNMKITAGQRKGKTKKKKEGTFAAAV